MNNEGNIWLALLGRINQWVETDIALPDVKFVPNGKRPYIWVQPIGLSYDFDAIRLDCGNEYRGVLNISCMVPLLGWNYSQHVGMAGRVCDHWAGWSGGGVSVFKTPRVLRSPYLDGPHNRLDVEIDWRCFA